MVEIFGTSVPIEEARANAKARAREGKKPGQNLIVILIATAVVFFIDHFISSYASYIITAVGKLFNNGEDKTAMFLENYRMNVFLYLTIVPIILYILYAKIFEKRKITTLGFIKKNMPVSYLMGIGIAILLMGFAAGFCVITGAMTIKAEGMSAVSLLIYISGWLIQGLSEEVMCRGFLMTSIARRYSVTLGVIINSVLFAVLHLGNPGITALAFANLCLFGLFMSLLFIRTDSIWACAACHSVWNLMQGNILGIPVSGLNMPMVFSSTFNNKLELINGGSFGLEGGLGVTLMLLIACSILFISIRKRNEKAA